MFASFRSILDTLVAFSIIGGVGVYFVLDYNQTERAKIQQSLEFAKILQSSEARAASFDLFEPWRGYDLSALNAAGPAQAVIEKFVRDVVTSTEGLEEKIYETASFYDTLSLCIETGACHAGTAQGLLGEGASDFYCLYRPVIEEMRRGRRETLGLGLERFALKHRGCDAGAKPASSEPTSS